MGRGKRIVCLIVFTLTISLRLVFSSKARESAFGTLPPVKVEIPFSVELLGEDAPVTDFRVYMEPSVESPNATLPEPYYL
ncbi:MAG: sortase, partial [Oribacterium parvum]|nr:sortase [Oribacterium parvum]